MSRTIDERIVQMQFDNAEFERGVKTTMGTLEKLKASLNFDKSVKSLETLQKTSNSVDFSKMANDVSKIADAFTPLGIVSQKIIRKAVDTVTKGMDKIYSAVVSQPIKDGLSEYETQLTAIQTILANTQSKGTTIDDVTKALDELNTYADQTIYNFTEMTRNIGTFTAAGVGLEASTQAIKGISNLAAMSSSTSQQASTAMYQLSQALASGTVKLQDWNSVVNAGMGGEVFQEALKRTARNYGIAVDQIIEKTGSFRESLKEGWITSDVLTETLGQIAGAYSEADLLAKGYTQDQADQILQLADTAMKAATEVKSFSQMISTLKEAMGSGWTKSFEYIFGNINEAKKTFTQMSTVLGSLIEKSSEARNALLKGWSELGGRDTLFKSIANLFWDITTPLYIIKNAFYEIFPKTTENTLIAITNAFHELSRKLMLNEDTASALYMVSNAVFRVLKAGVNVIVAVGKALSPVATKGLNFVATVLQIVAALTQAIAACVEYVGELGVLEKMIAGIQNAFGIAVTVVGALAVGLISLVGAIGSAVVAIGRIPIVTKGINALVSAFGTLIDIVGYGVEGIVKFVAAIINAIQTGGLSGVTSVLKSITDGFHDIYGVVSDKVSKIVPTIEKFVSGIIGVNGLSAVKSVLSSVASGFNSLIGVISGKLEAAGNTIRNFISNIQLNGISTVASQMASAIGDKLSAISQKISVFVSEIAKIPAVNAIITALATAFTKLGTAAGKKISSLVSNIKKLSTAFKNKNLCNAGDVINAIAKALKSLYSTGSKQLSKVITAIQNFAKSVVDSKGFAAVSGIITTVVTALENLYKAASTKLSGVISLFKSFINSIKTNGLSATLSPIITTFTSGLGSVSTVLSNVIGVIKTAGTYITSFFSSIASGVAGLLAAKDTIQGVSNATSSLSISAHEVARVAAGANTAGTTLGTASDAFSKFKDAIVEFADVAFKKLKNVDLKTVIATMFGISLVSLVLSMSKLLTSLSTVSNNFALTFKTINTSVTNFTNSVTKAIDTFSTGVTKALNRAANAFWKSDVVQIAAGIAILAASLYALSKVPAEDLEKASMAMLKLAAALGALMLVKGAVAWLSKGSSGFDNIGFSMAAMAASVLVLVVALQQFEKVTLDESMWSKLGVLGILMLELVAASTLLSRAAPKMTASAIALLAFAVSTKKLAEALKTLGEFDGTNVVGALDSLTQIALIMMGLALVSNKVSIGSSVGLMAMAGSILLFEQALEKIAAKDSGFSQLASVLDEKFTAVLNSIRAFVKRLKEDSAFAQDVAGAGGGIMVLLTWFALIAKIAGDGAVKAAIGVAALIGCAALLEQLIRKLDGLKFPVTLDSEIVMLGVFIGWLSVFATIGSKASLKLAVVLPAMIGSLALLAKVFKMIQEDFSLSSNKSIAKASSVLTALGILIASLVAVTAFTETAKVGPLLAVIGILGTVVSGVAVLSLLDANKVSSSAIGLGVAIAAIAVCIAAIAQLKADQANNVIKTLLPVAVTIGAVTAALYVLVKYDMESIIAAGVSLGIAFVSIAAALRIAKDINLDSATTLMAACLGAAGVALALSPLAQFNTSAAAVIAAGGSLAIAMISIAAALRVAKGISVGTAGVMLLAAVSACAVALALTPLATCDWQSIIAAGGSLSVVMLALSASAKIANESLVGALAMGAVGLAAAAVASGLAQFAAYDWTSIVAAGAALSVVMVAIAGAANLANGAIMGGAILAAVILAISVAMLSFGKAAEMFGTGALSFATSVQVFADALDQLSTMTPEQLENLVNVAKSVGESLAVGVATFFGTLGTIIAQNIQAIIQNISAMLPGFSSSGIGIILSLISGITSVGGQLLTTGSNLATEFYAKVKEGLGNLVNAGRDAVTGLIEGVQSRLGALLETGKAFGNKFIEGFRAVTGWHSPWSTMIQAAGDAARGFISTAVSAYNDARATGAGFGGAFVSGVKAGLGNVGDVLADTDIVQKAAGYGNQVAESFLGGDASDHIAETVSKITDATKSAVTGTGNLSSSYGGLGSSAGSASSAVADNTEKIQNAAKFMEYAEASVKVYAKTYGYLNNVVGDTTGVDAGIQAIEQLAKSLYEAEQASGDAAASVSGAEDRIDEIKSAFIELYESIDDAVSSSLDTFEKFSYSFENNSKKMVKSIKSNNTATEAWADGLQYLVKKGFDDGIIKKISEEGPSSLNTLTSMLRMSQEEVAEFNREYQETQTKSSEIAATAVAAVAAAQQRKIQMDNLSKQTSESASEAADASVEANDAMVESVAQTAEELKAQGEVIQAIYENIKGSLEDMLESQLDYFSAFDGGDSVLISEFIGNMESQIAGYNQYAMDWENLAKKGYSDDFLLELEQLGVDGANYVNMLSKASEENVARINKAFEQLADLPERTAQRITDSLAQNTSIFSAIIPDTLQLTEQMSRAGADAASGFVNGIGSVSAQPQASELGLGALESLKTELEIQSPSKKTYQVGVYYVQGFIEGIVSEASAAFAAVEQFASGVLTTAADVWEINSPSKVMSRFGGYLDKGLANGITGNSSDVKSSLSEVAGSALSTTETILDEIAKLLDSGIEMNPVIRPVFDMSDLTSGAATINNLMPDTFGFGTSNLNAVRASTSFRDSNYGEKIQNDNSDIISAINRLDERLYNLGNAVTNMKIVMDTGATVGALEETIDRRLNQRAVRAGRGN